jgi:hypothetical protein
MIRLLATLMFLSMGLVLYPQGSAVRSQAYSTPAAADTRYCAKPAKETEPPDILPETRNTGADNLFDLLENPTDQGLRKLFACPHR